MVKPSEVVPLPGKSCGTCTECCKMLSIEELQKPGGVYCSHCTIGGGCNIYPDRPTPCRTFLCSWLYSPLMGPNLKPEKCHVVMVELTDSRLLMAECDPDLPDAWRAPAVINFLRQAAAMLGSDWRVYAAVKGQRWLVTQDAIVSEAGEVTSFVGHKVAPTWRVALVYGRSKTL
jgi:hypothetical protein